MVNTCRDFEHHPLAQDTSAQKGNIPYGRGGCCSIINLTLNYEENLIRSLKSRGWCGSNANYDRWLRDSVISYVTFTFLSFILERMILCDLFWLASLFTKVTSGKSSHFLFKSKLIQSFAKSIFWYLIDVTLVVGEIQFTKIPWKYASATRLVWCHYKAMLYSLFCGW